jgi:hypothetical protein
MLTIANKQHADLLASSVKALLLFLKNAIKRDLECVRIARAANALALTEYFHNAEKKHVSTYILSKQRADGGWTDPEETAWAISLLAKTKTVNDSSLVKAYSWLSDNRQANGGWSRHSRDFTRIPTSALVIALAPNAANDIDRNQIRKIWLSDLDSPVVLSYKAGFYLLAESNEKKSAIRKVDSTITIIEAMQNEDGGFGPWKNHPIGSDPWSTGIVLWGLSKWIKRVDPKVIERALAWLEKMQLPTGFWSYHYLDEGTSYALIGAVSAMKALATLE